MKNSNIRNIKSNKIQSPGKKTTREVKSKLNSPKFSKILNMTVDLNHDIGTQEYIKCVKLALNVALEENDKLRELIIMLKNKNNELVENIQRKDQAIDELANYYFYCNENHKQEDFHNNTRLLRKKSHKKSK
jgi:hypothetical protein